MIVYDKPFIIFQSNTYNTHSLYSIQKTSQHERTSLNTKQIIKFHHIHTYMYVPTHSHTLCCMLKRVLVFIFTLDDMHFQLNEYFFGCFCFFFCLFVCLFVCFQYKNEIYFFSQIC